MADRQIKNGATSVILRVQLWSTSGMGLTALTSASTGLIISTVCDNEVAAVAYTVAGSTIEAVTTNGTYAAPTATKCRFKKVDDTNNPGLYEIQLADARFAVASAKELVITFSGAANLLDTKYTVELQSDVNVTTIAGTAQTARDLGASVLLSTGTGTGQLDFTSGVVKANATQLLGTAWLTPGTAGTPDVNAKLHGGTAQTGRDIGASVLLSNGTGTGQVKLASGYLAITWADVAAPTTTVDLSGTTIKTTQKVDVDTIKTNPVVNGGTITFPTTATLASTTNITAGTITTATTATNLTTNNDKTGYGLSSAAVQAIWDALSSALTTANSIGKRLVDYLTGDIYARVGAPAGASVSADVAAIQAKTTNLPAAPASTTNITAATGIDVTKWAGTTAATPKTAGVPVVDWIPSGYRSNTAQAGAAGTITLDASASATTNFYKYVLIQILSGTGAGQSRICTAYNGSTKVATVVPDWITNPSSDSVFATMPLAIADVEGWMAAAPNALTANGNLKASLIEIIDSILLQSGSGVIRAAFQGFFNTTTPVLTCDSVNQTGDSYARIGAAGVSLSAIPDLAGVTTLLSRLSSARAGYLDNLSAGAAALQSSLAALITTVGTAGAGLTAADDAVIAAIAALNNLSQANVRTALGLASANLDTQLAAIAAYIDTEVAAIKAKTDNLPAAPAATGDFATLEGRLTSARAGYLDNLSAGAAALQSSLAALVTTVGTAGAGLTAADDAVIAALAAISTLLTSTGTVLTAAERTAIATALKNLADGAGTGVTPGQSWQYSAAAAAAKTSGMSTTAPKIRNIADARDLISGTTDANNNRTAVTLNPE